MKLSYLYFLTLGGFVLVGFLLGRVSSADEVSRRGVDNGQGDVELADVHDVPDGPDGGLEVDYNRLEAQIRYDQGISYPALPTIDILDSNWEITDPTADLLDLSRSERKLAQAAIDGASSRLAELVTQNTTLDQELSDFDSGIYAYRIAPFMADGHEELRQLHERLIESLPKDKADDLFRLIRWRRHLGACGANDVLIVFNKDVAGGSYLSAQLTRRHSMTGKVISTSSGDLDDLAKLHGYSIDMFTK